MNQGAIEIGSSFPDFPSPRKAAEQTRPFYNSRLELQKNVLDCARKIVGTKKYDRRSPDLIQTTELRQTIKKEKNKMEIEPNFREDGCP